MLFSQIWSILLLIGYLVAPRLAGKIRPFGVVASASLILAIGLLVRLVPMAILPVGASYDIESYHIVGELVLDGEDVYASQQAENRHPYLPLQMYWSALISKATAQNPLSFPRAVKLLPVLTDTMIAGVLFFSLRFSSRQYSDQSMAFLGGLLYALNPIPVFVSAYHGQFDALPALFTLLSFHWLSRTPGISGLMLGFGILSKSWPVLALPSLLSGLTTWSKRLIFLLFCGLVPLLGLAVYRAFFDANLLQVALNAISYNWGLGVWGYTYFIKLLAYLQPGWNGLFDWWVKNGRYLTLAGLGLIWWIKARKQSPQDGFLTILVCFFAFTHAFSIQYMMWLVPFAILGQANRWLNWYTIAAFIYMFVAYNTLILVTFITRILPWPEADLFIIIPLGLSAWLVCVAWALERLFGPGLRQRKSKDLQSPDLRSA